MHYRWFWVVLAGIFMSGCTHYISEDSLRLVSQPIPYSAVKQNPDNYIDSYLLVGGEIVKVTNSKEGGEIEVVQLNIDSSGRPLGDIRNSEGRFLAQTGYFVDPAVYKEGSIISIVGQVKGKKVQPLESVSYPYPLFAVRELHLWRQSELYPYYQSYSPYSSYSFPYDSPYGNGMCDFGFGPSPYYDMWAQDRCFLFDQGLAFPPVFDEPERHRHKSNEPDFDDLKVTPNTSKTPVSVPVAPQGSTSHVPPPVSVPVQPQGSTSHVSPPPVSAPVESYSSSPAPSSKGQEKRRD